MSSRPNRVLALVVGGLLIVTVVVVVVAATRSTPEYDLDTPEGAVQAYLTAVLDHDSTDAAGYLADDRCTVEDLDRAWLPERVTVVLRDSEVEGDTATVDVDVISSGAPLLEPEYSETHTFRLVRSDGDWRITGQPWPMYECGMRS